MPVSDTALFGCKIRILKILHPNKLSLKDWKSIESPFEQTYDYLLSGPWQQAKKAYLQKPKDLHQTISSLHVESSANGY